MNYYRRTLVAALIALALLTGGSFSQAQPLDAEGLMARDREAGEAYKNLVNEAKLSPEQRDDRRQWLVRRYPDSTWAARVDADALAELSAAKKWDRYVATAKIFLDQPHGGGQWRGDVVGSLAAIINSKTAPEATRRAALDALLPRVQNAAYTLYSVRQYIAKLPLADEEKWKLAKKAVEVCGYYPSARVFLWYFLPTLKKNAPAATISTELEWFLKKFGDDSTESVSARQQLLSIQSQAGNVDAAAQLKALQEQEEKYAQAVAKIYQAAAEQAKTDETGSLKTLDQLRAYPSHSIDSSWWKTYLHGLKQQQLQMNAALLAAQILPAGRTLDDIWRFVREQLSALPQAVDFNLLYFATSPEDIDKDLSRVSNCLKGYAALETDAKRRFKAHQMAAKVAEKLGAKEIEADYLFKAGKYGWDLDRSSAIAELHRAIAIAPNSPGGINANWFLSLLEGRSSIVQSTLPRRLGPDRERQYAAVELPKYTGETSTVEVAAGQISLKKYDPQQNLLAGQMPTVSNGQSSAAFATDGKAETAWQPDKLPAALIAPLRESASPQRLVLRFSEPTYFVVSLLDAAGRVLSRTERDWGFWEHFQSRVLWPDAEETLNLLPVGGACFIKIEIFDSLGVSPALQEIEAYPAPFAATGWHTSPPQTLPAPAGGVLRVSWTAQQPEKEITYYADSEGTRGFPIFRWRDPWMKTRAANKPLRIFGSSLGMEFYGESASISLRSQGRVKWFLENGRSGEITQNDDDVRASFTHPIADGLGNSRHYLILDHEGSADEDLSDRVGLGGVTVKGKSTASRLIRFGDGQKWSEWQGPLRDPNGASITIPQQVNGKAPTQYQISTFLDARSTGAQVTPQTEDKTTVIAEPNDKAAPVPLFVETPSLLSENLDAVADALTKRQVVVVYPKNGSAEEFQAAKRLAEKAGVYLVSDDVVLNSNRASLILAVGTPLSHRVNRQLLAMAGLWNDPQYLNDENGFIGKTPKNSSFDFLFATGETPDAVAKAAARLLARIPEYKPPTQPFRVFNSDNLEMVYAWQLHPDREKPAALQLRLAQNDRRGLQFGITANRDIKDLQINASTLAGPDGATLPAPQLRTVAGYEWEPFFGELRLPNLLSQAKSTPLAANTSLGVWLTARSATNARPGVYRGNISISADGHEETLPLQITVEPIALPLASHLSTFSFASMPWYFHEGSPEYQKALRAMAEDEADHGVNTVNPDLDAPYQIEDAFMPVRYAIAPPSTPLDQLQWQPYTESVKAAKPDEAIFFQFEKPVAAHLFTGGFQVEKTADIALSIYKNGQWMSEKAQQPVGEGVPVAVSFPTVQAPAQVVRFASTQPLQIGKLSGFADPEGDGPVTFDFSATIKRLDVFDAVYREWGLPLPTFLCYADANRVVLAQTIFGVKHEFYGGHSIATEFTRQLAAELKKSGREKRLILKVADEPDDIAQWARIARAFKAGGLPVMTAHSGNYPNIEAAVGVMNPWCPNFQHNVLRPFFKERQQAGDAVWWYICGVPITRITGTPIENLPFYWLTAKWNFDGALNYAALTGSEANETLPFRTDHGLMHRMAYLPDGTLLDSNRRELEGDGIQDYKLIEYIRNRIVTLRKANQKAKADEIEKKLNLIIDAIVPQKYGYSQTPADWHHARNALYSLAMSAH